MWVLRDKKGVACMRSERPWFWLLVRPAVFLLLLVLGGSWVHGCGSDPARRGESDPDVGGCQCSETGTLKLLLTDKPLDEEIEAVFVTISRVDVTFVDGQEPQTVLDEPRSFNLFSLQDGVTSVLGIAALPVGDIG